MVGPVAALAAVASGGGALIVLAGAAWSAVHIRQRRAVLSNGLIAAGTLVLGASGLLNSVIDAMTAFAVTLLAGIVVLFAGFMVAATATAPPPAMASQPPKARHLTAV